MTFFLFCGKVDISVSLLLQTKNYSVVTILQFLASTEELQGDYHLTIFLRRSRDFRWLLSYSFLHPLRYYSVAIILQFLKCCLSRRVALPLCSCRPMSD